MDECGDGRAPGEGGPLWTALRLVSGVLLVSGGFVFGAFYRAAVSAPMAGFGIVVWLLGVALSPVVLVITFVTRPPRSLPRVTWAVTAAVAFVALLAPWSGVWALSAAAAVGAVMIVPRRLPGA